MLDSSDEDAAEDGASHVWAGAAGALLEAEVDGNTGLSKDGADEVRSQSMG